MVRRSQGSQANTLPNGHASQTMKYMANANTQPARNAPANLIASARARRNVPNAATNNFSAAMSASERLTGSTYAGAVNGEKIADWALPTNGRPSIWCGFHSGASGNRSRAKRVKGRNWFAWSASSMLPPWNCGSSGVTASQGAARQR